MTLAFARFRPSMVISTEVPRATPCGATEFSVGGVVRFPAAESVAAARINRPNALVEDQEYWAADERFIGVDPRPIRIPFENSLHGHSERCSTGASFSCPVCAGGPVLREPNIGLNVCPTRSMLLIRISDLE